MNDDYDFNKILHQDAAEIVNRWSGILNERPM